MKVTQAMLDAAKRAVPELPIFLLGEALEAALADVPEPSIDAAEYRRLWGKCMDSRLAACKAHEAAEAKLARVQALADVLVGGVGNTLRAILDGDE